MFAMRILVLHVAASAICFTARADAPAEQTHEGLISSTAMEHRLRLEYDGGTFSGAAWDRLVAEGGAAQFFLIGEEHGIAENPKLVAQLFSALSDHGFSKLAIETSPTMARLLAEALARDGLEGLRQLFAEPGGEPAFFGMTEEAEMLAAIFDVSPSDKSVFWGTDYEVASDRQLLRLLDLADKPAAATEALDALIKASTSSWEHWESTGSPEYIFSFAGDPMMVGSVRDAWPNPDPDSDVMLNTLEQTLAVNQLWVQGQAWASNAARAELQRANFLRYWRAEKQQGQAPKVLAKYGSSHMIRGLSQTAVYDLGTLLPEIAALEGGHSVSLMVVPGSGSQIAALNPSTWTYEPRPAEGSYLTGIEPLADIAFDDAFTLIDLRPLRPVVGMKRGDLHDELFRVVHGFDLLLVMSGSTPSGGFAHE